MLLLLCELGGCAAPPVAAGPQAAGRAGVDRAVSLPWWRDAGDPLLSRLVDHGLQTDPRLRRDAQSLEHARARSRQHGLRQWAARLLGYTPPDLGASAQQLADARQRKAASIARAYVRVRRLQAALRLREDFQRHFRNDSDIAHWRREAGIVTGVDTGLAATLLGINASALAGTHTRLGIATDTLARRSGVPPQRLRRDVDDGAGPPQLVVPAASSAASRDAHTRPRIARERAALAQATARAAALQQLETDAMRTVADARTAYHLGTGDFATLYVAETAALRVRLARVAARADAADAAIGLLSAEALAMKRASLPAPTPNRGATQPAPRNCSGD